MGKNIEHTVHNRKVHKLCAFTRQAAWLKATEIPN